MERRFKPPPLRKIPPNSPFHSVDAKYKAVQMIGRTLPFLRTTASADEVDSLAESYEVFELAWLTPVVWSSLSLIYRLDLLATQFLRIERQARHEYARSHGQRFSHQQNGILSPYQAWLRQHREIPMTDEDIDALLIHNDHVRKVPYP